MSEPRNGLEFLDMLRETDGNKENSFDELSSYLEHRARERGVPIHGQFELTPLCNFDCRMCYAHLTGEQLKGRSLLTTEQWKDLIRQAYEAGMYQSTLTGGECLTYPGFEEIYLYLHSLGCEVNVLTNGELLDERWTRFFADHMPASIQITLYGNDNDSYERVTGRRSFDTVIANIKRIREADLPLQIAITPNRYLGEDVFDTLRIAKQLCEAVQINSSLFEPREDTGRMGQIEDLSIDDYIRIYRKERELDGKVIREIPENMLPEPGGPFHECSECGLRCGGGRSSFVINWNGEMHPSNRLEQITAEPLQDGFADAWKAINDESNRWPRVAECDECPYDSICDRCAATMLQYAEPGEKPEKLCERTRYLVKNGIYRIAACEG